MPPVSSSLEPTPSLISYYLPSAELRGVLLVAFAIIVSPFLNYAINHRSRRLSSDLDWLMNVRKIVSPVFTEGQDAPNGDLINLTDESIRAVIAAQAALDGSTFPWYTGIVREALSSADKKIGKLRKRIKVSTILRLSILGDKQQTPSQSLGGANQSFSSSGGRTGVKHM
ncbi:hypothetical protein BDM02DRAFT_822708 [Thelephora ganbajun]|uniref:Uncharacterized protein n=1 Tax=Thelephora ganbajun TaxID=370292 RepID=A0ACB6Z6G7_THEGA|nr:hypothetical protein BDM02DRAFT_822708 [Thelephora ganbajun]